MSVWAVSLGEEPRDCLQGSQRVQLVCAGPGKWRAAPRWDIRQEFQIDNQSGNTFAAVEGPFLNCKFSTYHSDRRMICLISLIIREHQRMLYKENKH